jgi:hypothetical protein
VRVRRAAGVLQSWRTRGLTSELGHFGVGHQIHRRWPRADSRGASRAGDQERESLVLEVVRLVRSCRLNEQQTPRNNQLVTAASQSPLADSNRRPPPYHRDHLRHAFCCKSRCLRAQEMRRETSRVFLMCPFCVRHLVPSSTTESEVSDPAPQLRALLGDETLGRGSHQRARVVGRKGTRCATSRAATIGCQGFVQWALSIPVTRASSRRPSSARLRRSGDAWAYQRSGGRPTSRAANELKIVAHEPRRLRSTHDSGCRQGGSSWRRLASASASSCE